MSALPVESFQCEDTVAGNVRFCAANPALTRPQEAASKQRADVRQMKVLTGMCE